MSGLPVLAFGGVSAAALPVFEVFHDSSLPLFATMPIDDPATFRAEMVNYLVDDLVVSRIDASAHTFSRSRRHLGDGTSDWITIQLHHRGSVRGQIGDDTSLDLGPGRVGVVDFAHPFSAWSSGGPTTWVAVPRERIERADQLGPALRLDLSSPRGSVLRAATMDLWQRLPTASATDAPALAAGITETINNALDPDRFVPTERDLRVAMEDFVKANLGDLDLGLDDLRAHFHCSRSSVYRAFEPQGGVANYIRDQRLLRCFQELSRPIKLPRRVRDVAERWGFENPSHFNRVFRSKFGLPPSALLGAAVDEAPLTPHGYESPVRVEDFHAWAGA